MTPELKVALETMRETGFKPGQIVYLNEFEKTRDREAFTHVCRAKLASSYGLSGYVLSKELFAGLDAEVPA